MNEQEVLIQVAALRLRMDERFDTIDKKFVDFDTRTRAVETDVTRIKSAGTVVGVILAFFGWDYVKLWLTSLMKS